MPLNTLRLNHQPSSHPNDRIVFIKPIPRPPAQKDDYNRAEKVLKAIAAQCLPIMKGHHLSVTTLEEYEPNPEFIGRNFNNGEIIQLVIKSNSGAWLPLNMIQMVMMHELAHNTHMNHGKGFWQTRNLYAGEMHGLWSKGYTGEGLWGQGRSLQNMDEDFGGRVLRSEELQNLPLCGGTFRSRQKKRKAKGPDLTWKEKRDKRIEKKFGKNGEQLGEDEDARIMLEIRRKGPVGGKPRVAQSKRGRELRAAAALARFETNKKEVKPIEADVKEEDIETETESEYEETDTSQEDAKDPFGRKMLDQKGQGMVRVCGEEDEDDLEVKREMQELANLDSIPLIQENAQSSKIIAKKPLESAIKGSARREANRESAKKIQKAAELQAAMATNEEPQMPAATNTHTDIARDLEDLTAEPQSHSTSSESGGAEPQLQCPICSMVNDPVSLNCAACAHVLDVRKDSWHWKCNSKVCEDSAYVNAGDCGICGVCGARKPVSDPEPNAAQRRGTRMSSYSAHISYI